MTLTRDHYLDVGDIQTLLSHKVRGAWDSCRMDRQLATQVRIPTAHNRSALLDIINTAQTNPSHLPHYGSCAVIHPWLDSCTMVQVERFVEVFTCVYFRVIPIAGYPRARCSWMVPIYGALHLIPTIIFKVRRDVSSLTGTVT